MAHPSYGPVTLDGKRYKFTCGPEDWLGAWTNVGTGQKAPEAHERQLYRLYEREITVVRKHAEGRSQAGRPERDYRKLNSPSAWPSSAQEDADAAGRTERGHSL